MVERSIDSEVRVPLDPYRRPRRQAATSRLEDTSSMEIECVQDLLWNAEVTLDEKEWGKRWFRVRRDVIWILCVRPDGAITRKDLNCLTGNIWLVNMFSTRLLTDT